MLKIKKYALFIIGSLLWFHPSYSSENYDLYDGDLEVSKNKSLISGVTLDELHLGKAALTVGYRELGGGIKHTYLVFEIPEIVKGEKKIKVEGVHFAGVNGYCPSTSVWGVIFGGGEGKIERESPQKVIGKFLRMKEKKPKNISENINGVDCIDEFEIKILEAVYIKHKSFIVDLKKAKTALSSINDDKQNGTYFSLKGWGVTDKDRTYNCTSYVATLLKRVGIDFSPIESTDLMIDHRYLNRKIEQFELKTEAERIGITVITPPSAQELLKRYNLM